MTEQRLIALIPGYQEGPRIAAVVNATRRHLPVVVVDDGSTDDTAARAEAAGATVLRQVPNAGKDAAPCAGFRHALEHGAEAVVTLEATASTTQVRSPTSALVDAARASQAMAGEMLQARRADRPLELDVELADGAGGGVFAVRALEDGASLDHPPPVGDPRQP